MPNNFEYLLILYEEIVRMGKIFHISTSTNDINDLETKKIKILQFPRMEMIFKIE